MTPFPVKPRDCKVCGQSFVPRTTLHRVCSPRCATKNLKIEKAEERSKITTRRQAAKTMGTLIAEAQVEFNAFIRARDAGQSCICCGKPFEPEKSGGSVDAGHFRSRGSAPHLRFNEDNCFAQRKNCNRPGGTTYAAFRAGVLTRIGEERLAAVEANHEVHKWTREELVSIKTTYRAKRKALAQAATVWPGRAADWEGLRPMGAEEPKA